MVIKYRQFSDLFYYLVMSSIFTLHNFSPDFPLANHCSSYPAKAPGHRQIGMAMTAGGYKSQQGPGPESINCF